MGHVIVGVMHPMYETVGPFTDAATAAAALNLSLAQLNDLHAIGSVLGMPNDERERLFPTWQFRGHSVDPDLLPVLEALHGLDPWLIGVWLTKPHDSFAGRTPRQALYEYEPATVARTALNDRSALTGP